MWFLIKCIYLSYFVRSISLWLLDFSVNHIFRHTKFFLHVDFLKVHRTETNRMKKTCTFFICTNLQVVKNKIFSAQVGFVNKEIFSIASVSLCFFWMNSGTATFHWALRNCLWNSCCTLCQFRINSLTSWRTKWRRHRCMNTRSASLVVDDHWLWAHFSIGSVQFVYSDSRSC